MSSRRSLACIGTAALLLAALFVPAYLPAQNGSTSGETSPSAEPPLPSRVPEQSPPSPEVPLPDASGHLRQGRIEWTGEIDPDLSWIGSPWDYLPPIDEESTTESSPASPEPAPPTTARQTPTPSREPPPEPVPPEEAPSPTGPSAPASQEEAAPEDPGFPGLPATPAPLGEVTAVSLPGTGWIYVGAVPRDADIDLLESQSGAGETLFRFRPGDSGEILLSFQRQDMVTGSFEESTLLLSVSEPGEGAPERVADSASAIAALNDRDPEATPPVAPPEERPPLEVTTDGDGDYQEARRLLSDGRRLEALQSFLRHYDGAGSPELNQEIASLAIDLGYEEVAYHFWEQNLRLPSEAGSAARKGLVEQRIISAPISQLEDFLRLLELQNEMPEPALLFAWARGYDADGDTPDIRRAILLYNTIVDWYPSSGEAPEAERRLRFLRRHFLEIR